MPELQKRKKEFAVSPVCGGLNRYSMVPQKV